MGVLQNPCSPTPFPLLGNIFGHETMPSDVGFDLENSVQVPRSLVLIGHQCNPRALPDFKTLIASATV